MSRLEDSVESQIRRGLERGEFDDLPGSGSPIDVSDQGPGWWARAKMEEIRSHDALLEFARAVDRARDDLWTLPSLDALRAAVTDLNRRIGEINQSLSEDEQLSQISQADAVTTWRRMDRLRSRR